MSKLSNVNLAIRKKELQDPDLWEKLVKLREDDDSKMLVSSAFIHRVTALAQWLKIKTELSELQLTDAQMMVLSQIQYTLTRVQWGRGRMANLAKIAGEKP